MLCLFSSVSFGSSFTTAKITEVLVGPNYGNTVILKLNQPLVSSSCHTNSSFQYAFNGATARGKVYLDVVLKAYTDQKTVAIAGYGDQCKNYQGIEDLYHIVLK